MMNVLLLNASYEPLQVISVLRAVNLLWAGKAERAGRWQGKRECGLHHSLADT